MDECEGESKSSRVEWREEGPDQYISGCQITFKCPRNQTSVRVPSHFLYRNRF